MSAMHTIDAEALGSQQRANRQQAIRTLLYHGAVGVLGFLMMYPILWLFAASLKGPNEIWTNMASLIPKHLVFDNYINGWKGFGGITFATFYKNSFIFAGVGTILHVTSSAVVAYAFARINFIGRKFWFGIMLLTLMLPQQVLLIPQYILFSKLGWLNTFAPLLVPRLFGHPFFIFLMVQFIRGIPKELDDAARIDGCGRTATFTRIIVPLIQPAVITAGIFSFYWTWGDFMTPLIYMNDPKLYTISLALRTYSDPSSATDWGAIFAMSALSLVPVFIIFVLCQKHIIEGISTSGLKG
jgi:multiple sugar transport system permease protein